jgi:phosphinothricin acetyltransferase
MTHQANPTILVRASTDADVPAMLAIYRHHVTHGVGDVGAYEPEPFEAEDLKQRRKSMRKHKLPHLVAEIDGGIAGYAYVVPFRKRPAYRYTVKHSIYVHPDRLGLGVGRSLLPALIEACGAGGYRQLVGYIDGANITSLKLHEACGFAVVGRLPSVAFKFGHWADTILVQRALDHGAATMPGLAGES